MKWLQNFMRGRYGVDQFGNFLLGLYLAIAVLSVLLRYNILFLLSLFVLIYCWFRILSRNTYKRSSENTRYLQKTYKLRMWISNKKKKFNIVILHVLIVNKHYEFLKEKVQSL